MIEAEKTIRRPGYDAFFERCVDDVSFLWFQRCRASTRADYTYQDLREIDHRLLANLRVLHLSAEQAFELACEGYSLGDAGCMFVAAVQAFSSAKVSLIERVLEDARQMPELRPGLFSAFGWMPGAVVHPWIKKFLLSKVEYHKLLGVVACSVRREDPGALLTRLVEHSSCLDKGELAIRICRLIGEIKRQDLFSVLVEARQSEGEKAFWAYWSAILLGDKTGMEAFQPFVITESKWQDHAIDIAFRSLPVTSAREWINELADKSTRKQVIRATGVLGDPQTIPWLLVQMHDAKLARIAGEAFSNITGVDLQKEMLCVDKSGTAEEDDDQDDSLPLPSPTLVESFWSVAGLRIPVGVRHFLGKTLSSEHLLEVYRTGNQRQRVGTALELALQSGRQILLNHVKPSFL